MLRFLMWALPLVMLVLAFGSVGAFFEMDKQGKHMERDFFLWVSIVLIAIAVASPPFIQWLRRQRRRRR